MKKKIKDLTIDEILEYCSPKTIFFCQKKCPLQDLCFNQFCDGGFDLEKEVEIDE